MPVITYSSHGGMHYKKLLEDYPDDIHRIYIDYAKGCNLRDLLCVARKLELNDNQSSTLSFLIKNLYECFVQRDA